jgi:glucosamine--fructose-6-phosphate aminotransferase (isomerizing)
MNHTNLYISDILDQPQALRDALKRFDPQPLQPLVHGLQGGDFDRLILTGMGASLYGSYPAWLHLTRLGLPVSWVDASELVHYAPALLTPRTLVWIVSQSGRSAEIVALLALLRSSPPGALLATVNDLDSPLGRAGDAFRPFSALLPIGAAPEATVSTRTYLNTLALTQLAALYLNGAPLDSHLQDLRDTAQGMAGYLNNWGENLGRLTDAVGLPQHLVILGRGSSLASALTGALIMGEAAKMPAIGLPAGEFRHGPLEMCGLDVTILLFAGPPETRHLNFELLQDLSKCQVKAFWLDHVESEGSLPESSYPHLQHLPVPSARGIGLPLAEALPMQLLTISLCQQRGVIPGEFYFIGKVTTRE